ncbi:ABC transporter permease [Planococcus glaciei]|uniref:ABC transporter permease n=1 Tax=Planococcus glaciei TaxID=459472 RepID=UPI00069D7360|nr:ABC transporter permease subunit [Planococcus glaciei]KOF12077.1 ABC transporter permease [Planococcus glaciei]MBX0314483.1 ABC transporter permease [Planococcus glaciei]
MTQFNVLLKKEWRENFRNYKVFWIPIVFILFGIIEPVTNYFMPQILDSVGNLPDGAVIEIPPPEPEEILVAVMGQYQLIGILVLVLAYMGSVAGERKNGTATLLYVRPLSYRSYFLSKWILASAIGMLSVWSGLLAAYYYTFLLFERVDFTKFLKFGATYSLWILLIVSLVLLMSAALPNAGLAAAGSLLLIFVFQLIDGLLGTYWTVSPLKIPGYAAQWLLDGPKPEDFWWTIGIGILLVFAMILAGIRSSKANASKTKV